MADGDNRADTNDPPWDDSAAPDRGGELLDDHHQLIASVGLERAIIGALLAIDAPVGEAIDNCIANDFFDPVNRKLFEAITRAYEFGYRISMSDLVDAIGFQTVEGVSAGEFIARLVAAADANANIAELAVELNRIADRRAFVKENEDHEEPKQPKRFKLTRFDQIELSTRVRYLIKGLIPRLGLVTVYGPKKCGKSYWIMTALLHVALGWEYRGRRVEQGPIVYLVLEGQHGFADRLEAFRQEFLHEYKGPPIPFYIVTIRFDLVQEFRILIEDIRLQLGKNAKPAAICVDTLNRSFKGSENDDQDMTAYVNAATALAEAFECVVPIVHHSGVDGTRPRGHTALSAAVDCQIKVFRDEELNVVAQVEFQKDGPDGDKVASRLIRKVIMNDELGDPIDTCICVPVEDTAPLFDGKKEDRGDTTGFYRFPPGDAGTNNEVAFNALSRVLKDKGAIPPKEIRCPNNSVAVLLNDFRDEYMRVVRKPDDDDKKCRDRASKAIDRALPKWQTRGLIGQDGDWVWRTGRKVFGVDRPVKPTQTVQAEGDLPSDIDDFLPTNKGTLF